MFNAGFCAPVLLVFQTCFNASGMSPKKRVNGGGVSKPPTKSRKTADELQRLSQEALQRNPHIKIMEKWMHLS